MEGSFFIWTSSLKHLMTNELFLINAVLLKLLMVSSV
jgi:hypothetical protein